MKTFPLRIGTPDGLLFEGEAERVVCRTITGDLAILAGHSNFCTALGMGHAHVVLQDGTVREAACIGGMLPMMNGTCRVMATTWEWKEDIDEERAAKAKARAEKLLEDKSMDERDYRMAEARLKRALLRLDVKG